MGVVFGLALSGLLAVPMSAQAAASVAVPDAVARILTDTNALRAAGGLAPLVESAQVDAVAQNWSAQMFANGALTHNPNYSTQIPAGWTSAGENIASGYTYTAVVEAWHQSPGHYANIMGNYNTIGIGYYELNGQTYFTQDFGNYATVSSPVAAAPTTPAPAPAAPTSAPTPVTVAVPPAAAPAEAASGTPTSDTPAPPMKCVRWSHHRCTKYQVIKPKIVKKMVRHTAKRVVKRH